MEKLIKLIPTGTFASCLSKIKEQKPNLFSYEAAATLPWAEYQESLTNCIIKSVNKLSECEDVPPGISIPKTGLKGVYFCIGDDGSSLDIGGSLYFDEEDWAANADFYPDSKDASDLLINISKSITPNLKHWEINYPIVYEIMYIFSAFTIFHTMKHLENKQEIFNCGIAMGFSSGGELTLGHFINGKFKENLIIVESVF
jgi:hypothetical protein